MESDEERICDLEQELAHHKLLIAACEGLERYWERHNHMTIQLEKLEFHVEKIIEILQYNR